MTKGRRLPKIFFGWWIVLSGGILCLWGAGYQVYGFSALFKPIAKELGFSRAETSIAASIGQVEGGIAAPVMGWFTDRFGPRRVVTVCAVILGLGRALGETMAVTMVIGNGYRLTASLFSPGTTIASKIAGEFSEASSELAVGSLVELALVLFAITLLVNVVARVLVWRMTSVKAAKE